MSQHNKNHVSSKVLAQQKRKRRRLLTFVRMCRYGVNNFSRNSWMTLASIFVMTLTLSVLFVAFVARTTLVDAVADIKQKVDFSIYVSNSIDQKSVDSIKDGLQKISNVETVQYIPSADGRKQFAQANAANAEILNALNEANDTIPSTFKVQLKDIDNYSALQDFVKNDTTYKTFAFRQPSFETKQLIIEKITQAIDFVQKIAIVAVIVFFLLSLLVIFNSISLAIFSRKEEIHMMKLIGADRSFIRGPFLVEAMMYGFIAAIFATGIGVVGLYFAIPTLQANDIPVQSLMSLSTVYAPIVLAAMIVIGALIGILASLFATRRHLKIE